MPYTAAQVDTLQTERTNDPAGRGYAGFNDAQFETSVNLADIAVNRFTNTQEIFEAYVGSELPARTSDEWQNLILLGSMNAGIEELSLEGNILAVLLDAFPSPFADTTRANLNALRTELQSRTQILGLPVAGASDVARTS